MILVCLGNAYMKDDGLGLRVAELLKQRNLGTDVSIEEHAEMDFTILENVRGASKIVVVDALKSGKEPGTVSKFTVVPRKNELTTLPSLHSLALTDVIDVASSSGMIDCPVVIVGVEPKDDSMGEGLSPEVQSSLPKAIEAVLEELS